MAEEVFIEEFGTPQNDAPAATVRRRGESRLGQRLRGQGYSDEQLYGQAPRGRGLSAAAEIAQQRENRLAEQERVANEFRQRELQIREAEYLTNLEKDYQATEDKKAIVNQVGAFNGRVKEISAQAPYGTPAFFAEVFKASLDHPLIGEDERTRAQLNRYEETYLKIMGGEEAWKQSVIEKTGGEVVPKQDPQTGRYDVSGAETLAAQVLSRPPLAPAGMEVTSVTASTPQGSVTSKPIGTSAKGDTDLIEKLMQERAGLDGELAEAEKGTDPFAAEKLRARRAGIEAEVAYLNSKGKTPTPAPSAPEMTATNPTTGEKLVLRNGKWQPL